jgi:hypothetical protein
MGAAAAQVAGAVVGGIASRGAAKDAKRAQDEANANTMAGYNFSQPYIKDSYDAAGNYLDNVQNAGAYMGDTYAGPNQYQMMGNQYLGNMGLQGRQGAFDIAQQGQNFASNYGDLYQQAQQDNIGDSYQYARDNSQGLVDSAMRDDFRNLTENQLTGNNMNASASGNMNSSRAGITDANLMRGYNDRKADMTANIENRLAGDFMGQRNQQFNNAMRANSGLQQSYGQGINAMGTFGNMMNNAGANMQGFDQARMNDQRDRFERNRDFGLDNQIKYQTGILNRAVYNSSSTTPNMHSPNAAMIGGAMQGAGIGGNMFGAYQANMKAVEANKAAAEARKAGASNNGGSV